MSSDYGLICVKAMYVRRRFIVGITVIAAVLAVVRLLLFPYGSILAESVLVVSSPRIGGEAGEPFSEQVNPKVYQELVTSHGVLQEVLNNLALDGVFEEGDVPDLVSFLRMVRANINLVDRTTRPINYSPFITISAEAEDEAVAKKIVEEWADTAIRAARRTDYLRTGMMSEIFGQEEAKLKENFEKVLAKLEAEKTEFDVTLMREELTLKVQLINETEAMEKLTRQTLADAKARLTVVSQSLGGEDKVIRLFRSPADTAYWLMEGGEKDPSEKGLVTEVTNEVYFKLKEEEQVALRDAAASQATLEELTAQLDELDADKKLLLGQIAKHERIFKTLLSEETLARESYEQIGQVKSISAAFGALVRGEKDALGLNRLSDTIATMRTQPLRKRTVAILFACLGFALSSCYVIVDALYKPVIEKLES